MHFREAVYFSLLEAIGIELENSLAEWTTLK